jgi:GNAT superfamily N-acetyltransferase
LVDCVHGGASVSFMASLTQAEAEAFFRSVAEEVRLGKRILLAAFTGSELIGTVQVITATPPNQPHRADIAKLLVHRSARRQGAARLLMLEAEKASLRAGKTVLVLDTCAGGAAENLYTNMGWTRAGVVPRYALYPEGGWCDTVFFWKALD